MTASESEYKLVTNLLNILNINSLVVFLPNISKNEINVEHHHKSIIFSIHQYTHLFIRQLREKQRIVHWVQGGHWLVSTALHPIGRCPDPFPVLKKECERFLKLQFLSKIPNKSDQDDECHRKKIRHSQKHWFLFAWKPHSPNNYGRQTSELKRKTHILESLTLTTMTLLLNFSKTSFRASSESWGHFPEIRKILWTVVPSRLFLMTYINKWKQWENIVKIQSHDILI